MATEDYDNIDWENVDGGTIAYLSGPSNSGFRIRPDLWKKLFKNQKGKCAICGKHQSGLKRTFAIDHNHSTGEIRGLLCINCNVGLGHFQENRGILIKAIQYLRNWKK